MVPSVGDARVAGGSLQPTKLSAKLFDTRPAPKPALARRSGGRGRGNNGLQKDQAQHRNKHWGAQDCACIGGRSTLELLLHKI